MQNSGANQFNNILIGGSPAIFHLDLSSHRETHQTVGVSSRRISICQTSSKEESVQVGDGRQFMENVLFLIQLDANRGPLFRIIITIPFNAATEWRGGGTGRFVRLVE